MKRPTYRKYSTDELMETLDVFNVSAQSRDKIRRILETDPVVPDAGNFFRYYNDKSKAIEFEQAYAAKVSAQHALAVNSGTSALIAALMAVGVAPGDEVIVPAYTFFASVSAIVVARGIPVIVDIDESLTLDPEAVRAAITPRTKAIMPVHMIGHPCQMDAINDIASEHNLFVIEDTAQACGGKYKGKYLGTWGDFGCVSLDAYKVIGSGEGGILTTDDEWLYTRAQSYHDTAACWRPDRYARERKEGELFCGENYRMPELCAAVALAQLRKLDDINNRTRTVYHQLRNEIQLPDGAQWVEPHDSDGVCGYTLGILFASREDAMKAADIGIGGLAKKDTKGARDWHVYWNWEHILEQKTVTEEGCPFTCSHVKELPNYSPDMCPRTKDIMLRLGTIGINPTDTPEWASAFAEQINDGFAKLF
ncbi:MAG: DegT/DnrJ/EryC1/StrS family aminotransferase [Candidatus Pacebacteria bacterium]|nr:DegT/DnrJ/EryC1/StrS family aminotransferase [Candidatus Paceibacterota bacterium]